MKKQNSMEEKKVIKRVFSGTVVSEKMDKSLVVPVARVKQHPKYKKRYTVTRNYTVHDEKNQYHVGEKVTFQECRPLSKTKRWRVIY